MPSHDYFVEMTFPPFATLPAPAEVAAFAETMALPTLEACQALVASGRIAAGGPALAAIGFYFIARADSPQDLEDMLSGLALWPRALTRVVPLGTFESRATTMRRRLRQLQAAPTEGAGQPAAA
jgi:hypothetical protein